jgi:hypothetical protein
MTGAPIPEKLGLGEGAGIGNGLDGVVSKGPSVVSPVDGDEVEKAQEY